LWFRVLIARLRTNTFAGNELGYFSVDPSTGLVYAVKPLDREKQDEFRLTLEARQKDSPVKAARAQVRK